MFVTRELGQMSGTDPAYSETEEIAYLSGYVSTLGNLAGYGLLCD